ARVVSGCGQWSRAGRSSLHTTTVVGSKLFVFGGVSGETTNDMWALDLNCLKSQPLWESYEPTPGNEKPLPRYSVVCATFYNDTWSFDISTRKWTELQCTGSIPSPRGSHTAVLVDDVMYVFGGLSRTKALDDLYALQLSTQRWFKFRNLGTSPYKRIVIPWLLTGHVSLCLEEIHESMGMRLPLSTFLTQRTSSARKCSKEAVGIACCTE
ncbi:hypothetical protein BGY98DRAFT_1130344, partial [Russula aff. rugulosa BPL654]